MNGADQDMSVCLSCCVGGLQNLAIQSGGTSGSIPVGGFSVALRRAPIAELPLLLPPLPGLLWGAQAVSYRKHLTRDWTHVDHVDPDLVPIPEDVEYDIDHHQVRTG